MHRDFRFNELLQCLQTYECVCTGRMHNVDYILRTMRRMRNFNYYVHLCVQQQMAKAQASEAHKSNVAFH